jgi:hypothetical protein
MDSSRKKLTRSPTGTFNRVKSSDDFVDIEIINADLQGDFELGGKNWVIKPFRLLTGALS